MEKYRYVITSENIKDGKKTQIGHFFRWVLNNKKWKLEKMNDEQVRKLGSVPKQILKLHPDISDEVREQRIQNRRAISKIWHDKPENKKKVKTWCINNKWRFPIYREMSAILWQLKMNEQLERFAK